jgi:4a-hydroxytetrahydrobiopterin dehydratase
MRCREGAPALGADELAAHVSSLAGWTLRDGRIGKTFLFANYHETIAFVNAVAWIAHREDHHPDLEVHYNRCVVALSTHSAGGVTLNDAICAAKMEHLFA